MNRKQRRAAKKAPSSSAIGAAEALNNQGLALIRQIESDDVADIGEAIDLFRQACVLLPSYVDAHNNLGAALHRLNRHAEAIEAFQRALALKPDFASALFNRALALKVMGQADEAVIFYRRALIVRPDDRNTLSNLGIALDALNRQDEAETVFRTALALGTDDPEAYNNLGAALVTQGKFDEGMALCRKAIALRPAYVEAYSNISSALFDQGRFAEAAEAARTAVDFQPNSAAAHNNLGIAWQAMGRLAEAEQAFRTALTLRQDFAPAHYNLATTLLQSGQYAEGWRDYEWRWNGAIKALIPRQFAQPRWAGEDLTGRTILLYAEQGLGDILQFARYAPLVAARGARVILEVYRPLTRLLSSVPGVAQVVAVGGPLPAFDCYLPLMSAPYLLGTTMETIPAAVPYVSPDEGEVAAWKDRLAGLSGLKVGLVWSGDPRPRDWRAHAVDRRRSMALAQMTPLLAVDGVSFVSLQKGSPAAQLEKIAPELRPFNPMEEVTDFADTAALMANLDLVISVDTSVVHLAGALGKPVWVASRFDGCWRWLNERDDSPWYPTARLFRQTVPGDWDGVVQRLAEALTQLSPQSFSRHPLASPEPAIVRKLPERSATFASPEATAEVMTESDAVPTRLFPQALQQHQAGRRVEAETLYRHILDVDPHHAASLYNLGLLALGEGRANEAAALIRQAVVWKSDDPQAYYNLGVAYQRIDCCAEAADAYERALKLRAHYPEAHNNLGATLLEARHVGAAEKAFRAALDQRPDYPEAHYNLGTVLLLQGDYASGWREFEWRWHGGTKSLAARNFNQPQWRGEDLAGRTILLHAEQGLGDTLQFVRYASLIAAGGARVVLEVHRPLVRLLATVPGAAHVVAAGDRLPDFDVHLPLMSAPLVMGTTLETIPAAVPYVQADLSRTEEWRQRLAVLPGLKVGLAWAGEPQHDNPEAKAIDRRRSLAIERMAPLLSIPGVSIVSLQKGAAATQLKDLAAEKRPYDWMDEISDFAGTAALVANLDLVISVDTSVAHLAGAMGKPVWILSRFDGCWRWLQDREDSPWYPTVRLFRQATSGDWNGVVEQVAAALRSLAENASTTVFPARKTPPQEKRKESESSRLFDQALQHHRAGRLAEADTLYRRIIAKDPEHAQSHYNLGLIALQRNDHQTAVEKIRQALALQPSNAEALTNLGSALQSLDRPEEAIAAFRASLALQPEDARVHFNLAVALGLSERPTEALTSFRNAIVLNPALTEAYTRQAITLVALDQPEAAIASFRHAITLCPKDAETRYNLGMALQSLGKTEEAIAAFQATIDLDPRHVKAHGGLGALHLQMGRPAVAEAACRAAIAIAPDYAAARSNLAAALFDQGRFGDALDMVKSAIAFRPDFATAYDGLAVTLQIMGRLAEAKTAYDISLALAPDRAETHYNLATALLQGGDYTDGWREFEWRWRKGPGHLQPRKFVQPQWAGEDLTGRTLLLHGEQGLGDVLQFVRYATIIAARGAQVILEVAAPLTRLLASVRGVTRVVTAGGTLPYFDYHLPMMSAPDRLGTTVETIPADIPYITPDGGQVAAWSRRLAGWKGLKVGLVWAGNPRPDLPRAHLVDGRRSVALARLTPLLAIPGVTFVNLQKGATAAQLDDIAPDLRPLDWMGDVIDFADTAALVANLDLVIAVDTSLVHLAGAMGKPVWILSRYDGCWRWLMDREDSPWYPTARLFRQTTPGDWDSVVARVAAELKRLAEQGSVDELPPLFRHSRESGTLADAMDPRFRGDDALIQLFPSRPQPDPLPSPSPQAECRNPAASDDTTLSPERLPTSTKTGGEGSAADLPLFTQASQHHQAGRLAEAETLYRSILAQNPDHIGSLNNLSLIALAHGQSEQAAALIKRIIRTRPDDAEAHYTLGVIDKQAGHQQEAAESFERALFLRPNYPEARNNLGVILLAQGASETAMDAFRTALAHKPDYAEAYINLSSAFFEQGRFSDAIIAAQAALRIQPDSENAHNNLGIALQATGCLEAAEVSFRTAVALRADFSKAHCNLAAALLKEGHYSEGWQEHEWRRKAGVDDLISRSFTQPQWNGEDLTGRTILLYGEQGLGDVLQFSRYASVFAARGARVILDVYPPLQRLLSSVPGVAQTVAEGEIPPDFDYHLPMMSAPCFLGTTLETIPASIPYVTPDPEEVAAWGRRLAGISGLKVGLTWAGAPRSHDPRAAAVDNRRSIDLAALAPLLALPGIRFISLQKGPQATQCRDIAAELRPYDWMDDIGDFADTAALVANLDLVISVDTSLVHLAGAMGKPVWILSRYDGCWRWLTGRDDSPWYPTARLFRQNEPGNWDEVVARVAAELAPLAGRQESTASNQARNLLPERPLASTAMGQAGRIKAAPLFAQALRHHQSRRIDKAASLYRRILDKNPDHPASLNNLGLIALEQGRPDEAAALITRALRGKADDPQAYYNLGIAFQRTGESAKAAEAFKQALDLRPHYPEAHNNLGLALVSQGMFEAGEAAYRAALAQKPNLVDALTNLSTVLFVQGKFAAAAAAARGALDIQGNSKNAHNNLGIALQAMGRLEEAEASFRAAIALQTDFPEAHYNLSIALLHGGRYREGWQEYEWRWKSGFADLTPRQFAQPRWDGEDLRGRTILLYAEQGLGDVLQFARYAAAFAARGGRVVLEVYRPLERLLTSLPGVAQVVAAGETLPDFDYQLPLMSAPLALGATLDSIPATVSYIEADKALQTAWAKRLAGLPGLKVGLVWAGNPKPLDPRANAIDRRRSIPLTRLAPLLSVPGMSFISLQKGEASAQIGDLIPELHPFDPMEEVADFADTAALVANLDLVISVDTSVAHLAGALGKPVWILSRHDSCWRWLLGREDSPWYPTARLFHQAAPGDWNGVVARVVAELERLADPRPLAPCQEADESLHHPHERECEKISGAGLRVGVSAEPKARVSAASQRSPAGTRGPLETFLHRLESESDGKGATAISPASQPPGEIRTPVETVKKGNDAERLFAQAVQHFEAGRSEDAAPLYHRVLAIAPDHADSMHHLGLIALRSRRLSEAARWIGAVLALRPDYPEAHNNLGIVRLEQGSLATATCFFRRALILKPDYPAALSNWASALGEQARWDDATSVCRRAVALQPDFAGAYSNLGVIHSEMGRPAEAEANFRIATALVPSHTEAQYNLGTTLLVQGKYEEGWRQYEWRLQGDNPEGKPQSYPKPAWIGDDLSGRTILLYGEQGLGDLLQFSRYAAPLAARGAKVILEAYPSLTRLLATVPGVTQVVSKGDALPDFDCHLSVMSAPYRFGTTADTIPANIPYISADAAQARRWVQRLAGPPGLKVGLVWSGDPRPHARRAHAIDRRRSMTLAQMTPLLRLPGISFISLQKGSPAAQLAEMPTALRPHDWMNEMSDFADTADLVAALDLVISVDTSVVHLAGALGKPVWILSRFDGCWRWLTDREDSPWYPTARLFRQKTHGDWDEVVGRVAAELTRLAGQFSHSPSPSLQAELDTPETHGDIWSASPSTGHDGHNDSGTFPQTSLLFAEALRHHRAGRLSEARTLYLRILDDAPLHFDSLHHLGLIALWADDAPAAVQWISKAVTQNRSHIGAHINLGKALVKMGRIADAVIVFQMAIELDPNDAEARYQLGIALHDQARPDEAAAAYRDALALKPDFASALVNLGSLLGERERHAEAVAACRRALAIDPAQARARSNMGASLHELHRTGEAIDCYRQAITLDPDLPETHHNLATALLFLGAFDEGWREYEWRWKGAIPGVTPRRFAQPLWQGGPVDGRTILLHGEQGLGDVLQFVRYASLLAARGAHVILEVYPALTRLLATVPGVVQVVAAGDPLPAFDCHLPLMSAPLVLGTRIETIPATVPYVTAGAMAVGLWRERLSHLPGLKVGLVWAGDPRTHSPRNHTIDLRRSMALDTLKPLLAIPSISFVSLQKGDAARQIRSIGAESPLFDVMGEMTDFSDTAALVANLDLVIAVDTSVAHLAGALAKPVWILNRFNGCWRWLDDRESSPWYPTARLFRQTSPGDWDGVIERVAIELTRLAGGGQIAEPSIDALFAEALGHHQEGRLAEADGLYRRILAREPQHPVILHHRGVVAQQMENPTAAVAFIRQALSVRPAYMEAWTNLGTALRDLGERAQAEPCLRRAIQLRPNIAEAHNNLGSLCNERGRLDDAIAAYRMALSLQPENPEIHCNLAAALLERGDYEEGWREHEWRLHDGVTWVKPQPLPQPIWTGGDLTGRTILLRSEQGLGDDLQFARYATPIAARGARVVLEVQAPLTRLLATVPGVAEVVARGDALPGFDCYLSLMSAPYLLGTIAETIPADIPYVTPDAATTALWRKRLAHLPGRKVGLVWAGDPRPYDRRANAIDRRRSMPLDKLAPLLALPGLSFVSLQKGAAAGQIADLPPELQPLDLMDDVTDFADTAALLANLDLVISVDTSVVHLAGAMGKPVWILSRYDGCWRWLTDRDDSPWYPTARLFRQSEPGNWDAVVARVAKALEQAAPPRPPAEEDGSGTERARSERTESTRHSRERACEKISGAGLRAGVSAEPKARVSAASRRSPAGTPGPLETFLHRLESGNLADAMEHHRSGRFAEAAAHYRQLLVIDPCNVFALHHLGLIVRQSGDYASTERLIERAVLLAPDYAEALSNLGAAFNDQDKTAKAEDYCRRAVILKPDYAKAFNNLGKSFKDQGKAREAAICYRRAVIIDPHFTVAYTNLSAALQDLGQLDEALVCCEQALTLAPDDPVAHNNRGVVLSQRGDQQGAVRHYKRAAGLAPDYAEVHANLGMVLLLLGNFADGWREYEWRWNGGMRILRQRNYSRPRWAGEDPSGRTILLHAEQGMGDALQFARYATVLANRGANVILEVQASLNRLLASVPGVTRVINAGGALPPFDYHLPMMSAPFVLGTTVETIPAETPYLTPDTTRTCMWRDRLASLPGLKVGLVWAGNPRAYDPAANLIDHRRSMALQQMMPLLRVPGVSFISLQKDAPAAQLHDIAADLRPRHWMKEVGDFADTAALVANLDLVISVDTSVVHLAGALGKPVWIASRFDGCWRWLTGREDSPWYPTARLFRQTTKGDWDTVVARMAVALQRLAAEQSIRSASSPLYDDLGRLFALAQECHKIGKRDEAMAAYRAAIVLDPTVAAAYVNLAVTLATLDRPAEAVTVFRQAVAIDPNDFKTRYNLGLAEQTLGNAEEAMAAFQSSVDLNPHHAKAYGALGVAHIRLGHPREAEAACRSALALTPDDAMIHANLAAALFDQGRFAEAIGPAKTAIALRPDLAEAYGGLALTLQIIKRPVEARIAYQTAIALRPDDAEIHHNMAMALLQDGNYREGWRDYEWRWKDGTATPRTFARARWAGEDLTGRTILLWTEQGLGDVLQFVRYAAPIAERGAQVILEVQPSLKRLLGTVPGVTQVVAEGEPLPEFDFHLPMLSAPLLLGTTVETIPAEVPYISPDADRTSAWNRRLTSLPGLKVGLAWAGNPRVGNPRSHLVDSRRSIALLRMMPLLSMAGVRFISLQKNAAAAQMADIAPELRPLDVMDAITDFADTAALVANLDLVITVDTSVAHLAGAMGKPVWILSRYDGCWRWLTDRDDSPWYPTARLFRQSEPGNWDEVVARVAKALEQAISQRPPVGEERPRIGGKAAKKRDAAQFLAQAIMFHKRGDLDKAGDAYRQALALKPDYPEVQTNLGCLLRAQGHLEDAVAMHRAVVQRWPHYPSVWNNLGVVLKDLARTEDAIAAFRSAIALKPDYAQARTNLAHVLLLSGHFTEGWEEYEWRWKGGIDYLTPRNFPQPQWTGQDLSGRTILLHAEQGLGDVLQFVRYAMLIAARGARVLLEAHPPLKRLLASVPGVAQVLAGGDGERLPPFDYHLPLLSAPHALGTTLETIPASIPYLTPQATSVAVWNARLDHLPGMRVGLVWAGEPWTENREAHAIDQRRSIPLARLAPLLAIPGICFVSLQKGEAATQLQDVPPDLRPHHWMSEVDDFADTAALVANLDLVISVDTAVAHLAGAMGKPVWVLSRFDGCWRWLTDRDDSPWYPTARLFRQSEPGNWDEVAARLAKELSALSLGRSGEIEAPGVAERRLERPEADPAHLFSLAVGLHQAGRLSDAKALYLRMLASPPDVPGHAEASCNLGILLRSQGDLTAAAAYFRRALRLRPDYAEAHNNLGLTFNDLGDAPSAVTCYERSLSVQPDNPQTLSNLGVALQELGRPVEAVAAYRHAIAVEPGQAGTHYNLGQALLLLGAYEDGWREHEWLWQGGVETLRPRAFAAPRWEGSGLADKTILLYAEQGLGDTLQFARYATAFAAQGARVLLEVQPPLKRLLRSIPGVAQVLAVGETLPAFDCHLPLMGAPYRLGTRLDTVPATVPYVTADPAEALRWKARLQVLPGLKVGLVWAGDPRPGDLRAHVIDSRRSIPLVDLIPVLAFPGLSIVSLQKGSATAQIGNLTPELRPHNWMDEVDDFADTAALVANLDLVISVDTSVAHLAGALGKPVWILSRFDGCWRWLSNRDDSPWYPTARLFRQTTSGDWNAVVARVAGELQSLAGTVTRGQDALPPVQMFALAVDHHRAGRLEEAARLYERILDAEPGNVGCLMHLGIIAQQRGRHEEAVGLLSRAATRNDRHPELHDTLGTSFLALGRVTDAIAAHQRALALKPDFFEACYNLGNAYQKQGSLPQAKACFRRGIIQRPDLAEPYNNFGNLLAAEKNIDEAAIAFRRALVIHPHYAAAHNNLGNVLKERDLFGDAAACFEQALRLQPDYVEAHYNLGNTLLEAAMVDEAIIVFRRAVATRPNLTEAYNNLGSALHLQGHVEEAVICYNRALQLDPLFPESHSNLGTVLRDRGDLDQADAAYRHAIALDPDYVLAHCNLAVTLLLRGNYEDGLQELEWRCRSERHALAARSGLPPRWTGEDPAGRTILLQAEQGLGDVLQFVRYASVLAEKGARVILDVYPPLQRLLASVPGVAQVLTRDDALPSGIDWHLPVMSAPYVMGSRLETIPSRVPYLTADAAQAAAWKHRLARLPGMKVGLVWAGDSRPHDPRAHAIDRRRSVALSRLTPLLSVPGVSFVSLQKGAASAQLNDLPAELRPLDPMDEISDFADTAALVSSLDLVIAVDTSVAHLAGAMGKPVWILSRFDGCWRWLMDRDDSPWYPTARLFRQPSPGDWDSVAARLAAEMAHLAGAESGPLRAEKMAQR